MGAPKVAGPSLVKFTPHANRRIKQRGIDHRQIKRLMYSLPYQEGTHEYAAPGTDMRIVYSDYARMRIVITAMRR